MAEIDDGFVFPGSPADRRKIDHDAAIAKVRQLYTAEGYLGVPPTKEQCLYVADLAERAKRLEDALQQSPCGRLLLRVNGNCEPCTCHRAALASKDKPEPQSLLRPAIKAEAPRLERDQNGVLLPPKPINKPRGMA